MSAWVDVGKLLRPLCEAATVAVGFRIDADRVAPGSTPPNGSAHTVGDAREPGICRWAVQFSTAGGTSDDVPVPEQARLAGDKVAKWLCDQDLAGRYVNAITLPGVRLMRRESNGDGHVELGELADEWVETFTLTVQVT